METTHAWPELDDLVHSLAPLRLHLVAEPEVVPPGETCHVRWAVDGADEVRLWHTQAMPHAPEPLNWHRVFEAGEKVEFDGEREMSIEVDTAFFLIARRGSELQGERTLIETPHERERVEEKPGCEPDDRISAKMESAPHVELADDLSFERLRTVPYLPAWQMEWSHLWSAPPAPPAITITAPAPVIFTDETSKVDWKVSNTNCVTSGSTIHVTRLLPDSTNPSGTKYDGGAWGSGWTPSCGGGNPGSLTVLGTQGPRHTVVHVHGTNSAGKSGAQSQWVDTLGIPVFEGNATATRKTWIRATLRKIDTELRHGAVISDTYLDGTVKAFNMGCLNRKMIWSRMLTELQNMNITPITCEEKGSGQTYASYQSYAGRIILRWTATTGPSEYALCHELVHKAGFHESLFSCGLSVADIECGVDHVASAILGLQPDPC